MNRGPPNNRDPLDDPEYLRGETRRLIKIAQTISDLEIKRELAALSFQLAQRAEAIARTKENPPETSMNIERYRSIFGSDAAADEKRTMQLKLDEVKQGPNGRRTLRELATWYRSFAERAGNPVIWEARLLTADDLDAEAARLEHPLN